MQSVQNIVNKDLLIERVKEKTLEEKLLIGKIVGQVKLAKKNPNNRLNVDEKQLRAHLGEIIKRWEHKKVGKIINNFLESIKAGLQKKEFILLWGYFGLKVNLSPERIMKNPKTGKKLIVKAKNRISFRCSQVLKRSINQTKENRK